MDPHQPPGPGDQPAGRSVGRRRAARWRPDGRRAGRGRPALSRSRVPRRSAWSTTSLRTRGRRAGLRGHLGALARGELTTGALKVLGIGATGLIAAAVLGGGPGRAGRSLAARGRRRRHLGCVDRRLRQHRQPARPAPGAGAQGGWDRRAAGVAAPARSLARRRLPRLGGGALGPDLAERTCSVTAAPMRSAPCSAPQRWPRRRPVRLALLAGAVGLTLASERVSFTKVIERTPALARDRRWGAPGRTGRPVPGPAARHRPGRRRGNDRPCQRRESGSSASHGGWRWPTRSAPTVSVPPTRPANTLPNVLFEVAAGGALASAVVPLLALRWPGPCARTSTGRRPPCSAGRSPSWCPLPSWWRSWRVRLVGVFMPGATVAELGVAASFLAMFAVQIPLYGAGLVLTRVLRPIAGSWPLRWRPCSTASW